jgi:hypothetical protein
MARIESLINSNSYLGYLDIAQIGSSVSSICNNALREQKKNLSEIIFRINKRLEHELAYVRHYRYPQFSATCLKKLKLLKSRIILKQYRTS